MSAKKTLARVFSFAAAAMLVVAMALLTSCNEERVYPNEPIQLPLEKEETISYWICFDNTYMPEYQSYADHPFFKHLKEETNINIEFVVPSVDVVDISHLRDEWMNRITSGTTTDMVSHFWFVPDLEGSTIDSASEEELYYELTEYVEVQMPNFNALREQYAEIDKLTITPYQNIMYIPMVTGVEDRNQNTPAQEGLVIRKDFLDELQMDVPVTVDDWYNTLTAFKVSLGVEHPFWLGDMLLAPTCVNNAFITCYGQSYEWYINEEDGLLHYGATEEGTRQYVEMMQRWYSEGLVATGVNITRTDKLSDSVGAWGGSVTDIISLKSTDAVNANYELVAAPYPVLNEGDQIKIRNDYMPVGNREINCIYICQSYESPALAAKWIDQLFSEESYMRASYGIEGEDYTVDGDGNITFTDKIVNHPNGYLYGVNQYLYLGNMYADRDVLIDLVYSDEAIAAIETWSQATNENNIIRSTSLAFTSAEAELISTFGNFWMTQTGELRGMITDGQGVTGTRWDAFVENMNSMGLQEQIMTYRSAWERYLNS